MIEGQQKEYRPYTELSMLRTVSVDSWPADTLYIWINDEALPQLRQGSTMKPCHNCGSGLKSTGNQEKLW